MKHIVRYNNLNLEFCSSLMVFSNKKNKKSFGDWGEIFCRSVSEYLSYKPFIKKEMYFSITFCSDPKMKKLNYQYRNKNKTTDVLSFYLHDNLYQKKSISFPEINLGDIFISYSQAKKQSEQFCITIEDEIYHLMAHGLLHLLGLDHERSKKEDQLMKKEEEKLIKIISLEKAKRKKNGR